MTRRTVIATAALAGCSKKAAVNAGSKNFTEQLVLGEILAQHIESVLKIDVRRTLNLGGTLLAHQALTSGAIDLYPEYTGTALLAVLKQDVPGDARAVFERVRQEYRNRWNLVWMPPLGFENTFAMVVRKEDAREIATLSQAAARPEPWRLGAGYEFLQRADGLPGFLKAYPLRMAAPPLSMDLGLLYRALQQKQVDMVAANSTDGMLSVLEVVVLEDDRRFFPPYEAAPVVRAETLERVRGLGTALEGLAGRIDAGDMRRLNRAVDERRKSTSEIAREYLRTKA